MNPSKRKEKAIFILHIGKGFLVSGYGIRLDTLEPPRPFGGNTPEDWLVALCSDLIHTKNPGDSCYYKTFKVEIEIKELKYVPNLNKCSALRKLQKKREKEWFNKPQNKKGKLSPSNPSRRN